MEIISKIVRTLASLPLVGGALVFVLGFLPLLLIIPLNLSNGVSMIIGGLLMAAWCYFLKAKNIINIVTPLIPIPLWILGFVMAIAGVYGIVTNAWDDSNVNAETVPQEITPSKSVASPEPEPEPEPEPGLEIETQVQQQTVEPDAAPLEKEKMIQQANSIDLDKVRDEAAEKALVHMEKALADLEELSESIEQEKLEE